MLQIIPVIDIRGGKVVHARGGKREAYQPLESLLTTATQPVEVVADLLAWLPFPRIYIADLDAIEQGRQRPGLYQVLGECFPMVEFWLDSGIEQPEELQAYQAIPNLRSVIGSESLKDLGLLRRNALQQDLVLSLDRRDGKLLGNTALLEQPNLWPDKVIVMSLDHVGANQGPALDWLQELQACREDIDWYMAGGVRDQADLQRLEKNKVSGVLIASALHTGGLNRKQVACHLE